MRLMFFFKLILISVCISLAAFALVPLGILGTLRVFAIGVILSIAVTTFYPEWRGVKEGDFVSVVNDSNIPSLIGRAGRAAQNGRKNDRIRINLQNGTEVLGVIESYIGLISPPKIRAIYEEKLMVD